MEMFLYGFMQRAFQASMIIAIIAPLLGVFLIIRRQSLMADTLSHVSLAGVAFGLVLNVNPSVTTLIVVVIAALGIEYLRGVYATYSELSIAILMAGGLAVAL
ncbi:metal ABC transporter permease, partial [Listeria monocytogenes]